MSIRRFRSLASRQCSVSQLSVRRNSSISASTLSGVTFSRPSSLISTAGAPSQTPMHSANSSVILPSAVVPPGCTSSFWHTVVSSSSPPRRPHARLRQTHSRVLPSGFFSSRKKP